MDRRNSHHPRSGAHLGPSPPDRALVLLHRERIPELDRTRPTCKPTFTFTPDYTASVEELRQEFRRILESTPMWDKKVCVLQVSDATEQTMQIRALASASDFSKTWDLRCLVREKLIKFQQEKYPNSLPKARAEVRGLSPNGFSPNAQPIETTPSHARTGNPH